MANYRGWTCDGTKTPVVVYNPKVDQVYIINDTTLNRNKEMWKYDFESETWGYSIGTFAKDKTYSNFAVDKNSDIAVIEQGASTGNIKIWDDKSAGQNIRWSTGWLYLDNPSSVKQFYEVICIAKYGDGINISANVLYEGTSADASVVTDTASTALWNGSEFNRTRHRVQDNNSDQIHFVEIIISGTADEKFELHSLSIVHRDKGVV